MQEKEHIASQSAALVWNKQEHIKSFTDTWRESANTTREAAVYPKFETASSRRRAIVLRITREVNLEYRS